MLATVALDRLVAEMLVTRLLLVKFDMGQMDGSEQCKLSS